MVSHRVVTIGAERNPARSDLSPYCPASVHHRRAPATRKETTSMWRVLVVLALVPLLGGASDSTRPNTPIDPCAKRVTAKQFRPFAAAVWRPSAWQRGKPPAKTIRA